MRIKILTIQEKEARSNTDLIHINIYDKDVITSINKESNPEHTFFRESIFHKKCFILNNKHIELFPSCEITNSLFNLFEQMDIENRDFCNKNELLKKLTIQANDKVLELKDKIDKLKKSFLKRLIFLFKGEF